ncbi:MAG: NAD(P)/FAD-dependent oxidoreductase [Bacteroidetes bacterium]|nr:NAD(P)/FAD-dependent oxidoreductase [Bacteroidota bacterium]
MNQLSRKHIVILGAGFAGLRLARMLNNHPSYTITLIDKNNYHQFQPLLYQVALANLDASNISFPLRNIFKRSRNISIRTTTVTEIDVPNNCVRTDGGDFNYDFLVVATGATTNYFGNVKLEEKVFPMKSTWEALQIRNTLLQHFENAVLTYPTDTENQLSIVIVGGGPTGVELSGAFAEMKRDSLPDEYPELDFSKMKIYLLEGSGKLLGNMRSRSSTKARKYLTQMGVTVRTNTFVKQYDGLKVIFNDGSHLESAFVIWVAGVLGNTPPGIPESLLTKTKQLKTDIYNRVVSVDNMFALGDVAFVETTQHPKGLPQLASVAVDQAKNMANNFKRLAKEQTILPYVYVNKGSMATIGRNKAVVDLVRPAISFGGFIAWFIWMTLHLFLLIGFKNRLIVFINWVYKYFTHRQSFSLLFDPAVKKQKSDSRPM